ncbi:MAG: ATP-binding protein [Methanosarcinales archaeon]|nr:ATP-binding protein [Methanosarcinales archaeon]
MDFLIKEGLKASQLIQVCFDVSDAETKSREIRGMVEGLNYFDLSKGTIITSDYFHEEIVDGKMLRYVPLWYWLLEN